jgi:hypothetical protein
LTSPDQLEIEPIDLCLPGSSRRLMETLEKHLRHRAAKVSAIRAQGIGKRPALSLL